MKSSKQKKVSVMKVKAKRKYADQAISRRNPCTHLAGEYFAAAELSRRGFNVAMTVGNAKKVDLIIEDEGRTLPIQVKAIAKKQFVGWPMKLGAKHEPKLIFICIVLGANGFIPEFYILDGKTVQQRTKLYKTRAILNIGSIKDFKDNWALIERHF